MTILELAESFKMMKRLFLVIFFCLNAAYFSENIQDRDVKMWHNLHLRLQFMLSKLGIDIFASFAINNFSET